MLPATLAQVELQVRRVRCTVLRVARSWFAKRCEALRARVRASICFCLALRHPHMPTFGGNCYVSLQSRIFRRKVPKSIFVVNYYTFDASFSGWLAAKVVEHAP